MLLAKFERSRNMCDKTEGLFQKVPVSIEQRFPNLYTFLRHKSTQMNEDEIVCRTIPRTLANGDSFAAWIIMHARIVERQAARNYTKCNQSARELIRRCASTSSKGEIPRFFIAGANRERIKKSAADIQPEVSSFNVLT